jgi:hypothetical protein
MLHLRLVLCGRQKPHPQANVLLAMLLLVGKSLALGRQRPHSNGRQKPHLTMFRARETYDGCRPNGEQPADVVVALLADPHRPFLAAIDQHHPLPNQQVAHLVQHRGSLWSTILMAAKRWLTG